MLRNVLDSTTTTNGEPAAPVHVSVICKVTHALIVLYIGHAIYDVCVTGSIECCNNLLENALQPNR
jgi:hypothetical protein